MASPTAVPRMPASASGVSTTRASPKSFCRPSVIRKTPPSLPMSSPMSTTLASSSMARRRPRLSALPMVSVSVLISVALRLEARVVGHELVPLGRQVRRLLGVDVVEHLARCGVGHLDGAGPDAGGELVGLGLDAVEEGGVGDAAAGEVGLEPGDRVAQLPLLQLAGQPVAGGVVGGGVRAQDR